jgi:hypothetical protein
MIRRLRQRHLRVVLLLAILVPVLIVAAVLARQPYRESPSRRSW